MSALVLRNRVSESARVLAEALGVRLNALRKANRTLPRYKVFLNWGCSVLPITVLHGQHVINRPESVALAKCKLLTFNRLKEAGVPCPPFWSREDSKVWMPRDGIIIARATTRGSGGEGITVVRPGDELPDVPLYTQYIPKDREYRLHVVGNDVILIQQKRKENDVEQTKDQKLIRNRDNGWVFSVNNVRFRDDTQQKEVESAAIAAVKALGLDFGAVDMVVHQHNGQPYVLEINTAPGLESPTLIEKYVQKFKEMGVNG